MARKEREWEYDRRIEETEKEQTDQERQVPNEWRVRETKDRMRLRERMSNLQVIFGWWESFGRGCFL